jgi:hypothetical protein
MGEDRETVDRFEHDAFDGQTEARLHGIAHRE